MPEQTVRGPLDVIDFDNHFRPYTATRSDCCLGWLKERHLIDRERPKTLPQALKFGVRRPCTGPARIDELAIRR
jgi:hypothetical protein